MKKSILLVLSLNIAILLLITGCQSQSGINKTPLSSQTFTATATPTQTFIAAESSTPKISNSPDSESPIEAGKKQPNIKETGFEITQEDLVKLDEKLTGELSKLVVRNKNGEATFVLGMPARDMVNEYCKINPDLKKDKNKYINAFENDPVDEHEEPPALFDLEKNWTIVVLCNRKVGWIDASLNNPYMKETHQLLQIPLETATPQDIINLLGNPQQIGLGPESTEPFMIYNLDQGEKVLNLRFLFDGNVAGRIEMYIYDKNEFLHWMKDSSGGIKPDP